MWGPTPSVYGEHVNTSRMAAWEYENQTTQEAPGD